MRRKIKKRWGVMLGVLGVSMLLPQAAMAAPNLQDVYGQGIYYYEPSPEPEDPSNRDFDPGSDSNSDQNESGADEWGRGGSYRYDDEIPALPPVDHNIMAPELEPRAQREFNYECVYFGDEVHVADDTVYYASADLSRSGTHDSFNSDNPYTSKQRFYIGGFALVSEDGRLQEYECYLGDQIDELQLAPQFCTEVTAEQEIWIHLYTEETKDDGLGWIPASAAWPAHTKAIMSEPFGSVTASELYGCFSSEDYEWAQKQEREQELLDPVLP